ncbi:unnamed protein product [marine sediment metagenome]|uniref:Uncharacterized protein n=1 Tax=marine sediment metagenome TaxID=412755 RepID=X1U1N0_9ZZZZ
MTKKGGTVGVSLLPLKGVGGFFNKEVNMFTMSWWWPLGAERLGHT